MVRVAVVLSGCGVYDGAEIYESVLTLLYLDKAGAEVQCYAPDKPQMHVINHLTGQPVEGESRNVLVEASRIARGEIKPLSELNVDQFDAVIFPGGFGAAKNLCTFGVDGENCSIDPDVERAIQSTVQHEKVLGALCIAPAAVAKAMQNMGRKVKLTIGTDAATAGKLRAMGAENEPKSVSEITVDEENRIVSTPAYMLGPTVSKVAEGIEKLVAKVLEMSQQPVGA